jgi:hypothetical protein
MRNECYVFIARNKDTNANKADWYVNYSACHHFSNRKDWYLKFITNKIDSDSMIFSSGEDYKIARNENVEIEMQGKRLFLLLNIFFVTRLKIKHLSNMKL